MEWKTFIIIASILVVLYNIIVCYLYFKPEITGFLFGKKSKKVKKKNNSNTTVKREFVGKATTQIDIKNIKDDSSISDVSIELTEDTEIEDKIISLLEENEIIEDNNKTLANSSNSFTIDELNEALVEELSVLSSGSSNHSTLLQSLNPYSEKEPLTALLGEEEGVQEEHIIELENSIHV